MCTASQERAWAKIAALIVTLGCILIPASLAPAQDSGNPPGRVGRVALIDGTVSYHTADQNYWQAARRNFPITTGQTYWTEPNAHAALDIESNRIYLNSSTEFDVAALDDRATEFSLPQGSVFVVLRSLPPIPYRGADCSRRRNVLSRRAIRDYCRRHPTSDRF